MLDDSHEPKDLDCAQLDAVPITVVVYGAGERNESGPIDTPPPKGEGFFPASTCAASSCQSYAKSTGF
jgi:hypothetical protein